MIFIILLTGLGLSSHEASIELGRNLTRFGSREANKQHDCAKTPDDPSTSPNDFIQKFSQSIGLTDDEIFIRDHLIAFYNQTDALASTSDHDARKLFSDPYNEPTLSSYASYLKDHINSLVLSSHGMMNFNDNHWQGKTYLYCFCYHFLKAASCPDADAKKAAGSLRLTETFDVYYGATSATILNRLREYVIRKFDQISDLLESQAAPNRPTWSLNILKQRFAIITPHHSIDVGSEKFDATITRSMLSLYYRLLSNSSAEERELAAVAYLNEIRNLTFNVISHATESRWPFEMLETLRERTARDARVQLLSVIVGTSSDGQIYEAKRILMAVSCEGLSADVKIELCENYLDMIKNRGEYISIGADFTNAIIRILNISPSSGDTNVRDHLLKICFENNPSPQSKSHFLNGFMKESLFGPTSSRASGETLLSKYIEVIDGEVKKIMKRLSCATVDRRDTFLSDVLASVKTNDLPLENSNAGNIVEEFCVKFFENLSNLQPSHKPLDTLLTIELFDVFRGATLKSRNARIREYLLTKYDQVYELLQLWTCRDKDSSFLIELERTFQRITPRPSVDLNNKDFDAAMAHSMLALCNSLVEVSDARARNNASLYYMEFRQYSEFRAISQLIGFQSIFNELETFGDKDVARAVRLHVASLDYAKSKGVQFYEADGFFFAISCADHDVELRMELCKNYLDMVKRNNQYQEIDATLSDVIVRVLNISASNGFQRIHEHLIRMCFVENRSPLDETHFMSQFFHEEFSGALSYKSGTTVLSKYVDVMHAALTSILRALLDVPIGMEAAQHTGSQNLSRHDSFCEELFQIIFNMNSRLMRSIKSPVMPEESLRVVEMFDAYVGATIHTKAAYTRKYVLEKYSQVCDMLKTYRGTNSRSLIALGEVFQITTPLQSVDLDNQLFDATMTHAMLSLYYGLHAYSGNEFQELVAKDHLENSRQCKTFRELHHKFGISIWRLSSMSAASREAILHRLGHDTRCPISLESVLAGNNKILDGVVAIVSLPSSDAGGAVHAHLFMSTLLDEWLRNKGAYVNPANNASFDPE